MMTFEEALQIVIKESEDIQGPIYTALGGKNKLVAMVGAKDFVHSKKGLTFKLPKQANKINMITIELNSKDTYDISLANFSIKGGYNIIHKDEDIGAEWIKSVIEMKTGLKLSLK
jgi:hypothetical protein